MAVDLLSCYLLAVCAYNSTSERVSPPLYPVYSGIRCNLNFRRGSLRAECWNKMYNLRTTGRWPSCIPGGLWVKGFRSESSLNFRVDVATPRNLSALSHSFKTHSGYLLWTLTGYCPVCVHHSFQKLQRKLKERDQPGTSALDPASSPPTHVLRLGILKKLRYGWARKRRKQDHF